MKGHEAEKCMEFKLDDLISTHRTHVRKLSMVTLLVPVLGRQRKTDPCPSLTSLYSTGESQVTARDFPKRR